MEQIFKSMPDPKNDKQYCGVLIVILITVGVKALLKVFGTEEGKQGGESM